MEEGRQRLITGVEIVRWGRKHKGAERMAKVRWVSNEVTHTSVATRRPYALPRMHHLAGLLEATSHGGARDICRKKIGASTSLAAAMVDQT